MPEMMGHPQTEMDAVGHHAGHPTLGEGLILKPIRAAVCHLRILTQREICLLHMSACAEALTAGHRTSRRSRPRHVRCWAKSCRVLVVPDLRSLTRSGPRSLSAAVRPPQESRESAPGVAAFLRFRIAVVLQEHSDRLFDRFLCRDRYAFAVHHPRPKG